jgi:HAD superfamily hydrolase (TIGR01549 family)
MKYRAIIYDMGDILYDASAWRRWLHHYLKEKKLIHLSYQEVFDIWETRFLSKIHVKITDYATGFNDFLDYLGLSKNDKKDLLKINWEKKNGFEEEIAPFPSVYETLSKLKAAGIINCVLTDTELNQEQIRQKLNDKLKIGRFIDLIVASSEIQFRKPQKEAYHSCLNKIGLKKEEVVFVGHDQDELTGASDFGIATIAYNFIEPISSNFKIKNFNEILKIVI